MLIRRVHSASGTPGLLIPGITDSRPVQVTAPAKINLYLEVLGKRPDGYHEIEALILAIELFDDLAFAHEESGNISLSCDVPELSTGPDNLIVKAARLLKQRTGCPRGAEIRLTKRIPWAAGLGGGSSDAAATLAGLNELWELSLTPGELASLGAELGSDVPFFFHAPAAICQGRGERVSPVAVGRTFDIVLVKPSVGLSTADVYHECGSDLSIPHNGMTTVTEALASGNVEELGRGLHNRLQAAAMRICPPVETIYRRIENTGAAGCLLSGSGSCLFALCRDEEEAKRVAHHLLSGPPSSDELAGARVIRTRSCR